MSCCFKYTIVAEMEECCQGDLYLVQSRTAKKTLTCASSPRVNLNCQAFFSLSFSVSIVSVFVVLRIIITRRHFVRPEIYTYMYNVTVSCGALWKKHILCMQHK